MNCARTDFLSTLFMRLLVGSVLLVSWIYPNQVWAFYQWQNEQTQFEARGLVRGSASAALYPNDELLFPDRQVNGVSGTARLMMDADIGEHWRLQFNAFQSYFSKALATTPGNGGLPRTVERSGYFEKSLSDRNYAHLVLDQLALRWSNENLDLTLGRQAINLATTFYFTPNDFFAPFAAQAFYRVYKPGVDAIRAEIALGELSQVSLIGVLGYKTDVSSDTGWSDSPDHDRNSYLMRWSNAFGDMEVTALLGHVVDKNVVGGALQGEFFDWLGVRVEGHYARSTKSNEDDYKQLTIGLEHRWENSLELRMEWFYNGQGNDDVEDYQRLQNSSFYLGRHYTALGGHYEFTPLLTGEAVLLSNLDDQSHLISLNTLYSVSDEAELVVNMSLPFGDKPENGRLESEFGAYPKSINLEFRQYF